MKKGNKYGTHRVIRPENTLPQAAEVISNDMDIYDNEILIDVEALNIDSASFRQLYEESDGDLERMKSRIFSIVQKSGKMKNPVTGSGGVLIGKVAQLGDSLRNHSDLEVGDRLVTLVSLSLTPLKLERILEIHPGIDRVDVEGKAILFENTLYSTLPDDMPENVVMAVLDVAGAPAQTAKMTHPGDYVLILGAGGKSGILCAYEARKRVGPTGLVVGIEKDEKNARRLEALGFCHKIIIGDAQNAIEIMNKALEASGGQEYDLSINCLNVPNCEMSCILPVRDKGLVYFFSMATSFTKAALGTEGVAKDITMIVGNGYTKGHAKIALEELRESPKLMAFFEETYV
ncbi:MAG: L-erythro-3,5-diaminohexanoate dehydrogenase [Anaerolineaceae bacterium]|nr:L-erythro-3,5-diaminohexanoate dehydrogenase [Anaerolineaceae bacterium]